MRFQKPIFLKVCILPFVPESPKYLILTKHDVVAGKKVILENSLSSIFSRFEEFGPSNTKTGIIGFIIFPCYSRFPPVFWSANTVAAYVQNIESLFPLYL